MELVSGDKPSTLYDIWHLYNQEIISTQPQKEAQATLSRTKTALLRYTIPGWGLTLSQGNKLTAEDTKMALNYMKDISLAQLPEASQIQQQVFDLRQIPSNSQRTYRAALKKLLAWCAEKNWWLDSINITKSRFSSEKHQDKSAVNVRVTKRLYKNSQGEQIQPFRYGLGAVKGDVLPDSLQEELQKFEQFRTDPNSSNPEKAVRQSTVKLDLKHIRLILGWLHRYQNVPMTEMSLKQMVKVPSEWNFYQESAILYAEIVATETVNLALKYTSWLRADPLAEQPENQGRGIQSTYTEVSVLETFIIVAKFLYHSFVEDDLKNSVVNLLQSEINKINEKGRNERTPVSDCSKKWLHWREFLSLVEQLRQECNEAKSHSYKTQVAEVDFSVSPSLATIADSYQSFIFAALLAYLPPQRQQVYRNLHIGNPDKYINQNNSDNLDQKLQTTGYLYREKQGWFISFFPDTYNSKRRNGEIFSFLLPNVYYPDKKCFYEYLDEWIDNYPIAERDANLGGNHALRQALNPQHNFLFVKKNGERYLHESDFSNLLRIPACRISGKALTPNLLKKIFISYTREHSIKLLTDCRLGLKSPDYNLDSSKEDMWNDRTSILKWIALTKRLAQDFYIESESSRSSCCYNLQPATCEICSNN